jgi:hypothetical protein
MTNSNQEVKMFKLKIKTKNDAFTEDAVIEICRILSEALKHHHNTSIEQMTAKLGKVIDNLKSKAIKHYLVDKQLKEMKE